MKNIFRVWTVMSLYLSGFMCILNIVLTLLAILVGAYTFIPFGIFSFGMSYIGFSASNDVLSELDKNKLDK